MAKNDEQIKNLLLVIENKKQEIGAKPRASWKTNGQLKFDADVVNINTVGTINACVELTAKLLREKGLRKEASEYLEVTYEDTSVDDSLEDMKLRAAMLKWDVEKKKLDLLEIKLKDLRSEDLKTADAISDIMKQIS